MTVTPKAAGRLALLGLLGGIFQLTTVSQVAIFGVPADLSPLLVASVGFLTGSISGAIFGFSLGLFVDTVLMQTLGVNSLVLTAVGYGAGRPRASLAREPRREHWTGSRSPVHRRRTHAVC